jgi:hypothetical protein
LSFDKLELFQLNSPSAAKFAAQAKLPSAAKLASPAEEANFI